MSLVVRKLVFGVSDQVQHKPSCTPTEDDLRLEISDLDRRGIALSMWQNKGAYQLRGYLFVFAYTKIRFSHDTAHI